jgi:hypothetical protein
MAYVTIEDRVDRLEALFGQFLTEMALMNKRAEERHQAAEERHQAAEERNKAAEDRMARFEADLRAMKKESDKKWGDLANKMGTIIEDILAPNLRWLAVDHFKFAVVEDFMIRRSRRFGDAETEFDTLVVGPDAVILGEAKSSPSIEYAVAFARKAQEFFAYFPELSGRRLICVFGSWAIPDPVVAHLTRLGIYAMRMGKDTMELANAAALESPAVNAILQEPT